MFRAYWKLTKNYWWYIFIKNRGKDTKNDLLNDIKNIGRTFIFYHTEWVKKKLLKESIN